MFSLTFLISLEHHNLLMPRAFGWFGHRRPFTPCIYVYLVADVLGRLIAVENRTVEVEDKFLPADSQLPWSIAPPPR